MDKKSLSERDTCTKFITPALRKAGWDEMTQIPEEVSFFRMRRDRRSKLRTLYEAVAKQLLFTSEARPIDLLAIERALEIQVNDPSYGRPAGIQVDADNDDITEKDDGGPTC